MTQLNFDANTVAPAEALEVIPSGWYTAQMTASEMQETSDKTGAMLKCEFTVLGGEHAGRKLFDRLNLQNKNPVAVEIAYKTLSAICHAVGVIQVSDSQQLHGRPLSMKVGVRPAGMGGDGKQYDAQNEIKGYKAAGQQGAGGAAPAWAPGGSAAPGNFTPPAAFPPGYAPPAQPAPMGPMGTPPFGSPPPPPPGYPMGPVGSPPFAPPAQPQAPQWQQPPAHENPPPQVGQQPWQQPQQQAPAAPAGAPSTPPWATK
jgi:hypothetical protein